MRDPALLFYIDNWLTSTAEMDADCRGWYLNLILHNYDKKTLPNDIEKLASLAVVKFSEFKRFEQVFEQVLKQKFEQVEENRLTNPKINDILKGRENFLNKRKNAGKISYMMKYFASKHSKHYKNSKLKDFVKENLDLTVDTKNEHMLEHMFEHLFELYINGDGNGDINKDINILKLNCKNFFLDFYLKLKGTGYVWGAKDSTQLIQLLKKIEFKVKEKKGDSFTDEDLYLGFCAIISKINDAWVINNFSIPIINSKFNDIFTKITNGKIDSQNKYDQSQFTPA